MQKESFFDKKTKEGRYHRSILKIGILLASMLIAGGCYLQTQGKQDSFFETKDSNQQSEGVFINGEQSFELQASSQMEDAKQEMTKAETKVLLYVHVCGQVKEPGVYQVEEGARIYDAVQLAGGFTEEAFEEAVNLAKMVTDGEQIRIPDYTEAEQFWIGEQQTESSLINLNSATKEQLMTLTGIGEARAKDIIAYREEYGGFQTVEDVMKVPGIKDAAFAKIKNDITVK